MVYNALRDFLMTDHPLVERCRAPTDARNGKKQIWPCLSNRPNPKPAIRNLKSDRGTPSPLDNMASAQTSPRPTGSITNHKFSIANFQSLGTSRSPPPLCFLPFRHFP